MPDEYANTPSEPKPIKVTVAFPIAPSGPLHTDVPAETTVQTVRDAAMTQFGIVEDDQHTYYLTHSGARVADDQTIGDVAGHAQAVKFTLVKELIQG